MNRCVFCNFDKEKEENTILYESEYFYVIPSLGSIVEGYVLIVCKRHINSMVWLDEYEINEYKCLIDKYRVLFYEVYGKFPIVFEHGTVNDLDKNASSIIHAHTHIVNYNFKNEEEIITRLNFKKINDIKVINEDKNYIMYINSNNDIFYTTLFDSISQLMRLEIAKDIGLSEEYDWHKYFFNHNIILTINKLKGEMDIKK